MAVTGFGYLKAIDILCDASRQLFEPIVDTLITSIQPAGFGDGGYGDGGYGDGTGTVFGVASADSLYGGALVVLSYGTPDAELVTVLETDTGEFIANASGSHQVGDKVFGPTFPIQQPWDPLWTQTEMLAYLSTAVNDFLTECPLVYVVNPANLQIPATQPYGPLPDGCMVPQRVAFITSANPYQAYPLRETSQAYLDAYDYRWQTQFGQAPSAFYRDKIPLGMVGIWPRINNMGQFEVTYSARQANTMNMLDGFDLSDIFLPIIKCRLYSFAYSKDGESRNPGLAKYFDQRYQFGVKVATMILEMIAASDSDQLAQPQ